MILHSMLVLGFLGLSMDSKFTFRCSLWPVTEEQRRDHIICIQVREGIYYDLYREWLKQNKDELHNLRASLEPYAQGSEEAKKFYWKCVDTLAKGMGENTKTHRESLHKNLKIETNIRNDDGSLKSLTKMDTHEVWLMTEGALRWSEEANIDVRHLRGDFYGESDKT